VYVLLDTHTFLWWLDENQKLSPRARAVVTDPANKVLVSAASAWEIATKARLGKLPGAEEIAADVQGRIASQGFVSLDIDLRHAQRAGFLPGAHRDPFDRMLVAQAQIEDVPLVSRDPAFRRFEVRVIW
jgi:PIN domain nuclease of toxin-antitoxin system